MRNPKNMLIVGIVLLVVGVGILLFNPDQSAANLEIARNAKNAQEAAAAISGNNQRELMIHMAASAFPMSLFLCMGKQRMAFFS